MRVIDADDLLKQKPFTYIGGQVNSYCAGFLDCAQEAREAVNNAPTLTPPNEWVSVEDRLPDTDGAYLVYAPTYTGGSSSSLDCIGGIMFSRFKHGNWSIEIGYYKRPNCVTHWMPLPESPGSRPLEG